VTFTFWTLSGETIVIVSWETVTGWGFDSVEWTFSTNISGTFTTITSVGTIHTGSLVIEHMSWTVTSVWVDSWFSTFDTFVEVDTGSAFSVTSWTDGGTIFIVTIHTETGIWGGSVSVFSTFNTDGIVRTSFTFDVTVSANVSFVGILTIWAVTLWSVNSSSGTDVTMINGVGTGQTLLGTRSTGSFFTSVFRSNLDGSREISVNVV
jgi:hypothetical protein